LPPAEILACKAKQYQSLLAEHGIAMRFSKISSEGVCIGDATRNPTGAYKVRGALAGAFEAREAHTSAVVAASAGNHGAGLALAARLMGLNAIVYVPENAPEVKVNKIADFGAQVVRVGKNFDETLCFARRDPAVVAGNARFVHAFNDYTVAAGQGTIGLEILEHCEPLVRSGQFSKLRVFLPIGGGGLAAGVSSVLKTLWPADLPAPEIVGVVDEGSPAALLGLLFGRPIRADSHTIADGTRVALVGDVLLGVEDCVDHLLSVPHDEIVTAMKYYERKTGERIEGAGALGIAGEWASRRCGLFAGDEKVLSLPLLTGRNVDPDSFQATTKAALRLDPEQVVRKAFDVAVPEVSGELLRVLRVVQNYNIAGLTYKQKEGTRSGTLRVEFEIAPSAQKHLEIELAKHFPGTQALKDGAQMLHDVGRPVAEDYAERSVSLDDKPGEFLRYVEAMSSSRGLGEVGFLFYRKPPLADLKAQVIIGIAP
jgi:threonine dehydratase